MAGLAGMVLSITFTGVNPGAYNGFVQSIVSELTPSQPTIANSYTQLVTTVTSIVILFILVLTIIVIVVVTVIMQYKVPGVHISAAITVVVVALALAAIMWCSLTILIKWYAYSVSASVQRNTSDTVLYGLNSVLRDAFFVALCK